MGSSYGDLLRQQRETAGLTQQELAEAAIMTRTHITHIEAGRRVPSKDDARRLDRVLGTKGALISFRPGGGERRPVAAHFEAAMVLEQQANVIREFGLSFVPGILQTERYADAVLRDASYPPLCKEARTQAVATRISRARILDDPSTPVVWALLDEAVLRRPMGEPEVMAEQIMHLVRLVEDERIRTHVVPFGVCHPLLMSQAKLMWFEDQPPAVYVETLLTGTVHDEPALVDRIQAAYHLAMGEALSQKESLALMRSTAKEYGHHD